MSKVSDKKVEEVLNLLEKPVLNYIKYFMEKCGKKITQKEAENLLGNIGIKRYIKNNSPPLNKRDI